MYPLTQSSMSAEDKAAFSAQHCAQIAELLPRLGPLFGAGVLLFNAWDQFIDPERAWMALILRCVLVTTGVPAYTNNFLHWSPTRRANQIYLTHFSAIILAEFCLHNGLAYGLAGISACVFLVSVIAIEQSKFFLILSGPSLLLTALCLVELPPLATINTLMLYCFSIVLAYILMQVVMFFRVRAFLFEKELLHNVRHDYLTGICNRGYLKELGEREIAASLRYGRPLAIAMLDIDYFKRINDGYGHAAGDKVIQNLASTCQASLREIDHLGRIGGEEFACILPETSEEEARVCAERMRAAIEAQIVETDFGRVRYSVSIGVAMLTSRHNNWSNLMQAADQAMYNAKNTGRNRVVIYSALLDAGTLQHGSVESHNNI